MSPRPRPLPNGRSWPLRRAEVRASLEELGAPRLSDIYLHIPDDQPIMTGRQKVQRTRRPDGWLMYVEWQQPTAYFNHGWGGGDEEVSLWIRDVPKADRAPIHEALCEHALPSLAQWLCDATSKPDGWRILRHRHAWAWRERRIVAEEIGPEDLNGWN